MKLLMLSILMLFNACESPSHSQSYSTGDRGLYIFEYYPKIKGQSILCFLETQDTLAIQTSFKIYFTKDKISKVIKNISNSKYRFQKREDGNVYVPELKKICYGSKDFKENKISEDHFYKLLSVNFLDLDNKGRLEILNKLSE